MFCFERELSHFMREVMSLVYSDAAIPEEFDVEAVLRHSGADFAEVDTARYHVLFEQYFRFDVSSQKPYFYRAVQKFLGGLCSDLAEEFRAGWLSSLSLTPFDPVLIQRGSEDRRVDALIGTCAVLCDHGLMDYDDGGIVAQQYREFTSYFRLCSVFEEGVRVGQIYDMWLNFPYWRRCRELEKVFHFGVCATVWSAYEDDFDVIGTGTLPVDLQLSSLNFIRSWFNGSSRGYTKAMLSGLMRHCESVEMQVSRLSDKSRAVPWDQSIRVGMNDTVARALDALSGNGDERPSTVVDTYRSSVCERLDALDSVARSPQRAVGQRPVREGSSPIVTGKRPKRQSEVGITVTTPIGRQPVPVVVTSPVRGRQTAKKTSGRAVPRMRPATRGRGREDSPVVQRSRLSSRKRGAGGSVVVASDEESESR